MKQNRNSRQLSRGEERIQRAFRRSLWGLVCLVGVAGLWFLLQRDAAIKVAQAPVAIQPPGRMEASPEVVVPMAPMVDVTLESGVNFVHENGAYGERLLPETLGSGAAFFDYDNDGDQDLFLVNFTNWPDHATETVPVQTLYQNDGRGYFRDVTREAGLQVEAYGMGVAVADYDGDGWVDLFLTSLRGNRLFRNEGGVFHEVTAEAGVAGDDDRWSTGAAFFDYDGDGDLDLFVLNYVNWSPEIDRKIDFRLAGLGRAYGAPTSFTGTDNYLYRNEGNNRFVDVSYNSGIQVQDPVSGLPVGKGLGVTVVDLDGDDWLDILVANDTSRNFLFRNRGDGSFEETGIFDGLAYGRLGEATGGMGIDAAYFRNDRDIGVLIGNFANEISSLFVASGRGTPFVDEAVLDGLGPATRQVLTFGALFIDYDLDGRLDLVQANGHLEQEINRVQPSQHFAQPGQLFWNCGDSCRNRFLPVKEAGDLVRPMVGRAAAYADIDSDGDLDLVVTQNNGPAVLLRNDLQTKNHWLRVKLHGKHPNTDAIGARVELTAGGITQYRRVMPTRSYLSQVELPLTFGLGEYDRVDALTVFWPDGSERTLHPDELDRVLTIRQ